MGSIVDPKHYNRYSHIIFTLAMVRPHSSGTRSGIRRMAPTKSSMSSRILLICMLGWMGIMTVFLTYRDSIRSKKREETMQALQHRLRMLEIGAKTSGDLTSAWKYFRGSDVTDAIADSSSTSNLDSNAHALTDGSMVPVADQIRALGPNVRVPHHRRSLVDRLLYLEQKFAGMTNWVRDPHLWRKQTYACQNSTDLYPEHCAAYERAHMGRNVTKRERNIAKSDRPPGCSHRNYDHTMCLDRTCGFCGDWGQYRTGGMKSEPCVVYDFGIREEPQYGIAMATKFGCEVHAFDPSPITRKFIEREKENPKILKDVMPQTEQGWFSRKAKDKKNKAGTWTFHEYGAGGDDTTLDLFGYDWEQVSIQKTRYREDNNQKVCNL